jgi:GNAT superfamily N-acetyltransferase
MPQPGKFAVRQATIADLDTLVPLFDAYRQFYRQDSGLALAERFLRERLQRQESVIFLAAAGDETSALGFTQLYPSFSSTAAARIYILNDLFVKPAARRTGAATALLRAAKEFGHTTGVPRLTLSTEVTNLAAQALYESEGWIRQTDFFTYAISLAS